MLDLLPKAFFCVGCNAPAWTTICTSCKSSVFTNSELLPVLVHEVEAVAPLLYAFDRTQAMIRRWKETGGTDLRRVLFQMPEGLRRKLLELNFFAIVPIPQSRKRSFERGHESSGEVARFFSKKLDIPVLKLLELNERNPKRLTGLSRFEREFAENPFRMSTRLLKDEAFSSACFERMDKRRRLRFLLVDDLITSGSTLSKASEVLLSCFPQAELWAGSLGFRPKGSLPGSDRCSERVPASRSTRDQAQLPEWRDPLGFRNDRQFSQGEASVRKRP